MGLAAPGAFPIFFSFFKIFTFPFDALGPLLFLSSLPLFKIIIFPFDALGPRGGPYFLPLQKVGKDRRKGVSPPCESPDQSGVLDAPLWKPPSPRWRGNPGRTPRRLRGWSFGAIGEGRERVRARHGRRTSTASGWGLASPCPRVPQREKPADHARQRMVPRSKRPLRQRHRKSPGSSSRVSGEEFRRPLARLCRRHSSATAGGNPKGGAALFGQSLPTFCWPESRGPARPAKCPAGVSASKGKLEI